MIQNVRHTGIVVSNLQVMSDFYCSLGFVVESRAIESGEFIDQVVHLDGVKVEWIKLRAPDGCLLELLQYYSHPLPLTGVRTRANDLGCSHIALTVGSVEEMLQHINGHGGKITNPPALAPSGKVKVAYCHDPEGGLIELVEEVE